MGPSGCGKSTLLRLLGLMAVPSGGRLVVDGVPAPQTPRARARLRNSAFGYVHQEFAIIDDETVAANIGIPLDYATPRVARAERSQRVRTAAGDVGLEWALKRRASDLSGGERQRVAIARATINAPRIVLADEPTAALDTATAALCIGHLLALAQSGAAVIVATHDPAVAARCDRVIGLRDGRVVTA